MRILFEDKDDSKPLRDVTVGSLVDDLDGDTGLFVGFLDVNGLPTDPENAELALILYTSQALGLINFSPSHRVKVLCEDPTISA